MKRFIMFIAFLITISITVTAANISVVYNGKIMVLNGSVIDTGKVKLLPLRTFFESIGYVIGWDEATQSVTVTGRNNRKMSLQIDNPKVYINANPIDFAYAPLIIDSLTYVSTDIVSRLLECNIKCSESKIEIIDNASIAGYTKYPGTQVIDLGDRFAESTLYAKGNENTYRYYTYYASRAIFDEYLSMLKSEDWQVGNQYAYDNMYVYKLCKSIDKQNYNMTAVYGLMTFNGTTQEYVKLIYNI